MAKDDRTLLIITPGFPKNEADTTCLPSQQLFILALNRVEPALNIVILSYEYPFFSKTYRWHGNTVISLNRWKKGFLNKCRTALDIYKVLQNQYKEKEVIGLLSFWCTEGALVGKYFAKLHGLFQYTWILGQDAKKGNKYVRWMSPRAEELIAMSDFLANEFYKNHKVLPGHIVPNGIDTSLFGQDEVERDIDVLGVGSLIALKQYDVFISLIKDLSVQIPGIKAVICGKGSEASHLQSQINQLQLQNNVMLSGEIPHRSVLKQMQRAKILLHPSSYEGFSTVCLEALYAGAHVISFCNPMMMWIRHWHIAQNKEEMMEFLLDLLQDPETEHRPILPFSLDSSAKSILELFGFDPKTMVV